ncbi:MAG: hypothetical protein JO281_13145 [Pseudonocardiales bacterium]|nr:hypothetical protein [Pseudonocardiales bacterium]
MSKQIEAAGQRLFELFGACAAAPDDEEIGRQADQVLMELAALLATVDPAGVITSG